MFRLVLLLALCLVVSGQMVAKCNVQKLFSQMGKVSLCPNAADNAQLPAQRKLKCGEQAALVSSCLRDTYNASQLTAGVDISDECGWQKGPIVSSNTGVGTVVGTFLSFVKCSQPGQTFGGTVLVFLFWDKLAPYCFWAFEQNVDDLPWDGVVSADELKVHTGIYCTLDYSEINIKGIAKKISVSPLTAAQESAAMALVENVDGFRVSQTRHNANLRKLKDEGKQSGFSAHHGLIITICAGVAAVVVALAVVIVKARAGSSTDYQEMEVQEE